MDEKIERKDFLEKFLEKFTEQRVSFMTSLELHVKSGDLHLLEAVRLFEKATMLPPNQAQQYLRLMAADNSVFKNLDNYKQGV